MGLRLRGRAVLCGAALFHGLVDVWSLPPGPDDSEPKAEARKLGAKIALWRATANQRGPGDDIPS
ncbi:MAG: hypothetical protein ACJ74Z_20000, partial [Bryobacteraceae bacterium]